MRVFQKKKKIFSLRWVRNNSYFMNGSKILFKVKILINIFFLILLFIGAESSSFNLNFPLITLSTPFLILINFIFFIFWLLRFKWPAILFIIYLIIGFDSWKMFYQFKSNAIITSKGLDVMSFNVRSFNRLGWIENKNIPNLIASFIKTISPDVICFQEFANNSSPKFKDYPFKVFKPYTLNGQIGSCIISKYPLLNSKTISFEKSSNGGMQSDLIWKRDTLRLYNLHFESLKFDGNDNILSKSNFKKFIIKIRQVFDVQKKQIFQFRDLLKSNKYPVIICTDLNNNVFSKNYDYLAEGHLDAFIEKGSGFGATHKFPFLPMRIDFILTSKRIKVVDFKVHNINLSDHKPILASLKWP